MKYKSPFTEEITINNKKEARGVIMGFCDYCLKDAVGRFHCSWADSEKCQEVKQQIVKDFSNRAE